MEPLIVRGDKALMYGEWGSRKSWLLMDVAICLATERPWLGAFARGKALADETIKTGLLPVLRGVLDLAVPRGWLGANPLRGESLWRPAPRHAGPDASAPFTSAELPVILDAAEAVAPGFALMLRVWAQTGLRSGELRGLTWADYDARGRTVHVQRSRTHARLGPPKTLRSQRVVSVTHPVCEGVPAWQPGASAPAREVLDALAHLVPLDVSAPLFGSLGHPGPPMDEHELHRLRGGCSGGPGCAPARRKPSGIRSSPRS